MRASLDDICSSIFTLFFSRTFVLPVLLTPLVSLYVTYTEQLSLARTTQRSGGYLVISDRHTFAMARQVPASRVDAMQY